MKADLTAEFDAHPSHDDGSLVPVLIRLAWHSAGTYGRAAPRRAKLSQATAPTHTRPPARPPPPPTRNHGTTSSPPNPTPSHYMGVKTPQRVPVARTMGLRCASVSIGFQPNVITTPLIIPYHPQPTPSHRAQRSRECRLGQSSELLGAHQDQVPSGLLRGSLDPRCQRRHRAHGRTGHRLREYSVAALWFRIKIVFWV